MVYIVGAAAIGAGVSYYEGEQNRKAASDAADESSQGYLAGSEAYRNTVSPWVNSGTQANTLLSQNAFYSNIPAFNFNLGQSMSNDGTGGQMVNEAMGEISAQRAATGGFGSGNQITDVSNYIAGTYEPSLYNQAYSTYNTNVNSQYTQPYNELTGISNTGLNAATGAAIATNSGITNAGNAQASGTVGASNASSNGLTGASNAVNSGVGTYMNYLSQQNLANAIKGLGNNNNQYYYGSGTNQDWYGADTGSTIGTDSMSMYTY